jgi:hypothetical protein
MMDFKPGNRPNPGDILNMEFIKKRIKKYLEENQFNDILSKTIIKNYQDNFGFNKKDLPKIKEENEDIISNQENNENNISNIDNSNNSNDIDEHFSFKNKIKFNNIIKNEIESNPNSNNSNLNTLNNLNTKKSDEKPKISLGQKLLNNDSIKTKIILKNEKENKKDKDKEIFDFPKIKIKVIPVKKNPEEKLESQMIDKNKKDEQKNEFELTAKTDMTSYNPEESKYKFKFEDTFIDKNKICYENGEQEIDLCNGENYFFLETKKEDELKEQYDFHRNLNLLNSTFMGKSENEIENENKLINNNVSDIEEDEKETEEDIEENKDKLNIIYK